MAHMRISHQHGHIPFGEYFREWQSKGEDFKAALPFKDYCQLRQDEGGRYYGNRGVSSMQSSNLQRTTGRSPLPMHEGSTSPCESKPKKTGTVKKESLFFFRSRKDASTVEEVKKVEEKEEEVPCASNSNREEEITSPLEEACEKAVTLMEEQPHASTVGAANTFEDGTLVALQEVPNAHQGMKIFPHSIVASNSSDQCGDLLL